MTAPLALDRTINAFSLSHATLLDGTTGAESARLYGARNASLSADTANWDNTGDDDVLDTWTWLNYASVNVESGFLPFDVLADMSGVEVTSTEAGAKAAVSFTPEAGGTDAFDYSGLNAISFTINDGSGATTVALSTDLTSLAGVVTAIDTILGAGYAVTADTTKVKIEAATAGFKMFAIGGTDAAAITGSAGYDNNVGTSADTQSMPLWDEDCANQPPKPMALRCPARDLRGRARILDITLFKVQFGPFTFTGPQYKTGLGVSYAGKALKSYVDETGTQLPTRSDGSVRRACGRLTSRPQL